MDLNSTKFIIFTVAAVLGYYMIPKRVQWLWLLAFSYIYYMAGGWSVIGYMLFTTITTYGAARLLEKAKTAGSRRALMVLGLILNFGMLGILKYADFVIENINALTHGNISFLSLAVPLGISFYIFQSMGYLLDVYWKRIESEKNIVKFALFVSFFPQIMQGPIGRYSKLAKQLYAEHRFDPARAERAILRILWGFFKKMILADTAAVFVNALFDDYTNYTGCAILAVLFYSVQLYADFSGGIDIVVGIGSLFGIEMDENFRQPYFAISIGDFWHRWHITLGTWMKDYLFYPVTLSGWMKSLGKWARKHLGKQIGRALPIAIANVIVFIVVGIWHGSEWRYIVYGLYNGLIIGLSGLLHDNYRSWKKKLHINDKGLPWHIFMILRTFLLVNISWFFDRAGSVGQAMIMLKHGLTEWNPSQIMSITSESGQTAGQMLWILAIGLIILFVHSLLRECGAQTTEKIQAAPVVLRIALYLVLLFSLGFFGAMPSLTGGFIYAQF